MEKRDNLKILKGEKKINKLIVKVSINFFILLILFSFFIYSIVEIVNKKNKINKEIENLNKSNSSILSQIKEIETKSAMAKNYIKIWENDYIPNQKLFKGIDIKDVEDKINFIAKENDMINILINSSPVILTDGILEKKTIRTYTALITISFESVVDINVFKFLDDLKQSIGYFIVIQEITMQRTKKIDEEFLKSLSNGDIVSAVKGEIKIRLYGLGEK